MTSAVAFVLGREPGPVSVLHELRALLVAAGVATPTVVLDGTGRTELPTADLLVLKDLPFAVLHDVAVSGRPSCNPAAASAASLDKARVVDLLRAAGVPVPDGEVMHEWEQVRAASARGGVVVKPVHGTQGAGVLLLDGVAPQAPPTHGPWLVEERLRGDGTDCKLYVVGQHVDAVARTWPAPADRRGRPFEPDAALRALALSAAAATGLEVCGVDVLLTTRGPVAVDVNAFPGFKGVPGAAARLAGHLRARLPEREVPTCA